MLNCSQPGLSTDQVKKVCFFSILPLARFLEFGGEQLAFYLGKDLGDLVRVTLTK
jgi:hypothetical protein